MLRVLLWLGQILVVAPSLYESVVSLWGLRTPEAPEDRRPSMRLRVVVAAHDEGGVIEGIASDLAAQDYPPGLYDAWVVADRCSDDTAARASRHVDVAERESGDGGKGAAISWFLDRTPLGPGDALVVLDADNRVGPTFLTEVAAALDDGHPAVQTYLDVTNPDASVLTMAGALTYWASNRSVQLARSNLGWSCDLGGTGMAVTAAALADAGGFTDDLTDDLALNIRLNLAGHRTHWLHHTHVGDEKPERTDTAVTQRARWAKGKAVVRRAYVPTLLRRAVTERTPALFDLAMRLVNPGRSFLALLLVALTALAIGFPSWGLWSPWVLGGMTLVVIGLPLVFLVVDGIPGRYLIRYPYVVVIALLWLPIRVVAGSVGGWRRTPHTG